MRDCKQYERWKTTLGKDNLPKSLVDFQELKYNKLDKFEELKGFKQYVTINPKATKADHKMAVNLEQKGIKGDIHIPPKEIENVDNLGFDDYHINVERKHNITEKEAKRYIANAKVSATVWGGKFERYYGEQGACYVDVAEQYIRTAYSTTQFKGEPKLVTEEIKKWRDLRENKD